MWELIRANKRRSMVLVLLMLALLLALGFVIGAALLPSVSRSQFDGDRILPGFGFDPTGGFIGMGVAFCIWMVQSLIAYFEGGRILLAVSRAKPIEHQDHPQLYNVVEEMTIAARLPKMPQVYIIDDMALNAFATGHSPEDSAVAVTAGLLAKLNRDQLQGVIAHEISHIVNRDVLFMTMIGIMLGSIVMISEVFMRSLWYGAGSTRRYRSGSKRGGGAQGLMMVVAILLAILAPILAQIIYFASSRRREYLADAGSAVYTRYPEGLASALEVISQDEAILESANRVTAPMYISNPFEKSMTLNLTSTHPPINERIRILRGMAGGASYRDYQSAWAKACGGRAGRVPNSALTNPGAPIREAHPDAIGRTQAAADPRQQARQAGDLLRKVNQFLFVSCACGMRIKLPPEFKKDRVQCPRCQRNLAVPVAQLAVLGAAGEILAGQDGAAAIPVAQAKGEPAPPLEITRHGQEWMSFKCPCGAVKNLAPSFAGTETTCAKCGRNIHIRRAE